MKSADQRIDALHARKPVLCSVEFFPPKDDAGMERLEEIAQRLTKLRLDFVSITYGAGGSTRERSFSVARRLRENFDWVVMPHLTCIGTTHEAMTHTVQELYDEGFRNIMALGGDLPRDRVTPLPEAHGLRYGVDLVRLIRDTRLDICLGVGGYPEKHPRAATLEEDIQFLAQKVSAGANFVTTQLFFQNKVYFEFVKKCRAAGITVPIIPGVMPVLSLQQVKRFTELCGSHLPAELVSQLEIAEPNGPEAVEEVGVNWAVHQIRGLLAGGAPGVHLYILNRARPVLILVEKLGFDWPYPSQHD